MLILYGIGFSNLLPKALEQVRRVPTLRILQITPYAAGAWAYGGIPRAAAALSDALVRRGHHVTVATTDVCDERTRLGRASAQNDRSPLAVRVFPNRSNWLAYHYQVFTPRGLTRYLHEHVAAFDVVHIHAHRHLLEVIAASACRAHRVPFILTPNGTAPRIERRRLAKALWDFIFGDRVVAEATLVTAVTEAERRQLVEFGINSGRIRLLPNSVDLSEFDGVARRASPARESSAVVLFLGKLTPRKGVDVLVRALARVGPDVRLQIAGNDMGAAQTVRDLARELDLEARIDWLGLLRGADRLHALSAADLVVYPSRDEVFGLVALESLLCGTPVIVGDDSGCAELVRLVGGGSHVPPGDPAALADAIRAHLRERPQWCQRAVAAAQIIRRTFSSDQIAERAEGIYREAAALRLEATA